MLYPAYYDALRRLAGDGDLTKRITQAVVGSSALSPNAPVAAFTDAVFTPITAVQHDPANPRRTVFRFLIPQDRAVGLVIREIGLACADGTIVFRRVRQPIEKTADMEFGDRFQIDV
ncbi:phage tail protein [Methylobacterium gregans]|uniref:Uncharacterized protein n=2 Tax=Methylobacterium gregans TaxID=374424 RepID=A0AA37HMC0_9HYPH|nr:phage tail protein [Methylobacterium gregans]MDQ0521945.1 alkylation response protein AidB-like acyl-CoA dehydrogenase [Methylobacterium gregans]GJD78021.1 hypothetical protein NBEOAGPD_1233 [Methylobacterium gregans]GLS51991.1 hypothetical protein GCM10007886_01730 [Methylobacterium gregans]